MGHVEHTEAAIPDRYDPAAQFEHVPETVIPEPVLYAPAAHAEHTEIPVTEL